MTLALVAAVMVDLTTIPTPSALYPASVLEWHRRYSGPVEWRLTLLGAQGRVGFGLETRPTALAAPSIEQIGLLRMVYSRYGAIIDSVARAYDVPPELLAATIATESSGKADSIRIEPGYKSDRDTPHRLSIGLMQTLLSTAREALQQPDLTRVQLLMPRISITAGAAYIARQRARTAFDPPLVAAAYNAGSIQYDPASGKPWRLRCYPLGTGHHVTKWVRHFNAALAVQREQEARQP